MKDQRGKSACRNGELESPFPTLAEGPVSPQVKQITATAQRGGNPPYGRGSDGIKNPRDRETIPAEFQPVRRDTLDQTTIPKKL